MNNILSQIHELLANLLRHGSLPIASLDRSIASAADVHFVARRALAIAVAEEAREIKRREILSVKASDLEMRAIKAIQTGYEGLALQASEAIAELTSEIDASNRASQRFAAEVALARREVDAQRRRLAELDRGRRLAKVGNALNSVASTSRAGLDTFAEAEASLEQVRAANDDARAIRDEMTPAAERLIENMSEIGLGDPVRVRAIDVMDRLRARARLTSDALVNHSFQV